MVASRTSIEQLADVLIRHLSLTDVKWRALMQDIEEIRGNRSMCETILALSAELQRRGVYDHGT